MLSYVSMFIPGSSEPNAPLLDLKLSKLMTVEERGWRSLPKDQNSPHINRIAEVLFCDKTNNINSYSF
ncbi:hypothetical protein DPMN_193528 [Dreissena polymorpha]|uniref:Uncharacterized protein n=1 Tax=Dreissena polymorpha TaxID=45954 RepID=A0A9D3Y1R0_DREPO|nr:hypothetical protein DPMN_193528 [Dreissena polymorpha]